MTRDDLVAHLDEVTNVSCGVNFVMEEIGRRDQEEILRGVRSATEGMLEVNRQLANLTTDSVRHSETIAANTSATSDLVKENVQASRDLVKASLELHELTSLIAGSLAVTVKAVEELRVATADGLKLAKANTIANDRLGRRGFWLNVFVGGLATIQVIYAYLSFDLSQRLAQAPTPAHLPVTQVGTQTPASSFPTEGSSPELVPKAVPHTAPTGTNLESPGMPFVSGTPNAKGK